VDPGQKVAHVMAITIKGMHLWTSLNGNKIYPITLQASSQHVGK